MSLLLFGAPAAVEAGSREVVIAPRGAVSTQAILDQSNAAFAQIGTINSALSNHISILGLYVAVLLAVATGVAALAFNIAVRAASNKASQESRAKIEAEAAQVIAETRSTLVEQMTQETQRLREEYEGQLQGTTEAAASLVARMNETANQDYQLFLADLQEILDRSSIEHSRALEALVSDFEQRRPQLEHLKIELEQSRNEIQALLEKSKPKLAPQGGLAAALSASTQPPTGQPSSLEQALHSGNVSPAVQAQVSIAGEFSKAMQVLIAAEKRRRQAEMARQEVGKMSGENSDGPLFTDL